MVHCNRFRFIVNIQPLSLHNSHITCLRMRPPTRLLSTLLPLCKVGFLHYIKLSVCVNSILTSVLVFHTLCVWCMWPVGDHVKHITHLIYTVMTTVSLAIAELILLTQSTTVQAQPYKVCLSLSGPDRTRMVLVAADERCTLASQWHLFVSCAMSA